ncbi:hypothetical protein HanIR_Chr08g0361611 [Helianthus annuus]|nr:hypothetical protein HanIR_Chr08g0361611 [Helianthus annuus]
MGRLKITKTNEELKDKLANTLPYDEWSTYLMMLKNNSNYEFLNLSAFVEKIQAQELEFQKIRKLKSDSREKNKAATVEVKFKSKEIVQEVEEQIKEISAIKVEKNAEAEKMNEKCLNFENLKSKNAKLLRDLESLTLENKNFKNSENDLKIQIKNLENEKVKIEKDFQSQIKILEDGRDVFSKNNIEKQKMINSHLQKIIQLEKEGEQARKKINELENKLKGFVTSASYVCPEPINAVPISDDITNFDKVKIEDCDEKSDDENKKN